MKCLVLCLVLATVVSAQQSGDSNRDYSINFAGSFQSSYVVTTFVTGGSCISSNQAGFNHFYQTSAPNAPVVWALATQGTINWAGGLSASSIDIGPGGFLILLDGVNVAPPVFGLLARTDSFGGFSMNFGTAPVLPPGTTLFFAMAHADAASADGYYASQTHRIDWVTSPPNNVNCNPAALALPPCDDCSYNQPLQFPFMYYGQTYTQIDIGSNGIIGFGSGAGFEFTPTAFVSAFAPEIAPYTDDFNFNTAGCFNYYSDPAQFEVCWINVPRFGTQNSNSFRARIDSTGVINFEYGTILDNNGSGFSQILTGLTPGNSAAPGLAVDWSVTPGTLPNVVAPYEAWTNTNLADLQGRQILIVLDPMGNPSNWIFL